MKAATLNNLWVFLQGLSMTQKDREWLAGKLIEPSSDDFITESELLSGIRNGLHDVKDAMEGKNKTKTLQELIDEL